MRRERSASMQRCRVPIVHRWVATAVRKAGRGAISSMRLACRRIETKEELSGKHTVPNEGAPVRSLANPGITDYFRDRHTSEEGETR